MMTNSILKFRFDPAYLKDLSETHAPAYATAAPFPHIVIDNFLPEAILDEILTEFPDPKQIAWKSFANQAEKKLASRDEKQMGDATRFLLYQFNSSTFISFLEKLTGIPGVIPDPHFEGGGLHQIERGGYLKMHVDFNRHERLQLDRRLNVLIYLNRDWQEEYGGHLELWDKDMTACAKKILPVFNRCVVFSTTDFSYHGHPEPLTCPEDRTRRSLALYYYSNGRPASETLGTAHSTIFRDKTNQVIDLSEPEIPSFNSTLKKFIPPILLDLVRKS
jgi:Rps23 Pro-64 3,4-dihydroxylase Tpa1-like proline 4-hydroxylase